MINGKIKEWHLDQALLQKIAANGSIDISTILEDYLKKTDVITREQLESGLFDDITDDIQNLQNVLDTYRTKDTAITLEDIDSVFSGLLSTLQERLSVVESSISGAIDIEAFINQAVAEQLNLSIDSAINNVLNDAVSDAVDAKIDDLLESEDDRRLQDKIDSSVQDAMQDSSTLDDVRDAVLNSIANTFIAKDQLASTEEISNLQEAIDDINSRINDFQEESENNFVVTEENLDDELAEKINSAYSNAEYLSQQDFLLRKDGKPGQILIYDDDNELNASDILLQLNIVTNNLELNEQKAALEKEIYDSSTMTRYYLDRNKWNVNLSRNAKMETVPKIPEPEIVHVFIKTDDAAKVFDDTELIDQRYTLTGWPEDTTDTISVVVTGSQTEIGQSENTFTFEITNNDIPTKYEYDVEVSYGTLTVVETEEELEELLNPPEESDLDDNLDDDNLDDDTTLDDDIDDQNDTDDTDEPNDTDDPDNPDDPGEYDDPGYYEEPLGYISFNLASENLQTSGIMVTIDNGIISGTNDSLIDMAYVCFGFYGTQIKLHTTITTPEELTREAIKNYTVKIDGENRFTDKYYIGQECDNVCFLCVEGLSEGAHRVEFSIEPDTTFNVNTEVELDEEHAGLLLAEHIKPEEFYFGDIFDTADYVTEPEYEELKSDNVSVITIADYVSETIDFDTIDRRLVYATNSNILYYCYNRSIIALTRGQPESQPGVTSDDLDLLEARLQAYVNDKLAEIADSH